jgi:transcriptional regulator with XRE-family HTH domain
MFAISPVQIRMARASLNWTRQDLAANSGLSFGTIRNVEADDFSPRGDTAEALREVFEKNGLEFLPNEGVQRRIEDVHYFCGAESRNRFFRDILQNTRSSGDKIVVFVLSPGMLARCCGGKDDNDMSYVEQLGMCASIQCLLPDTEPAANLPRNIECRYIARTDVLSEPFVVYGSTCTMIHSEGRGDFKFVLLRLPMMAYNYKTGFRTLWKAAAEHPRAGRQ